MVFCDRRLRFVAGFLLVRRYCQFGPSAADSITCFALRSSLRFTNDTRAK